jgi:excisionase family DNA binding protein
MTFEILTRDEAAKKARISTRYLDQQIAKGAGPAITRIGGRVLVRTDALQDWLDQCTGPARSESV